ncbi:MAG: MBL fold metallo-hydrolase [Flavipsychrobacter sp.]
MSLYVCSIASGSNGNCYYIGNDTEAVLVDAGITCREAVKRMRRAGLSMDKVKAIFISHEHGDHIRGLEVMAHTFNLPVYITPRTLQHSRLRLNPQFVRTFTAYQPVCIAGLTVHPFPKFHDAADPHSFIVEGSNTRIGVFTDIGTPCTHVIDHFGQCHAVFLETNYDDEMLEKGRYPYHLKRRIKGDEGHLSNKQALDLFTAYRSAHMSHVFLSHLSKDNNCPTLAHDLFTAHAGTTQVVVASRFQETAVYKIAAEQTATPYYMHTQQAVVQQISLF